MSWKTEMHKLLYLLTFSLFLYSCSSNKTVSQKSSVKKTQLSEEDAVAFGKIYIDAAKEKVLGNNEAAAKLYKKALTVKLKLN